MAFSNYGNTGPFTNNAVPPGISATFLNNIENFLDQIVSSAVADSHITADGTGAATAVSLTLTAAGTGLTVQHNALISGTLSVTGAATLNAAGTGLTVAHNATIGGTLTAPTIGGSPTFTGVVTFNNTLNLKNGSLTNINFGFSAVTTGGTTITHGLGVIPSAVLITPSAAGITFFVASSMSSSTFTAFVSSNNNVWWLAIA